MPLSSGQRAGIGVMAGILLVTIALVITLFVSGKEKDRAFQCLENLRRFSMAMRSSNLGLADPGWDKVPLGSEFWGAYKQWPAADSRTSPLTDEMLTCPYVEKEGKHIDYLGPARLLRELDPDDPVGADKPGNHEVGGNVLLKKGSFIQSGPGDDAWAIATQKLKE